jgi:type I restriction enzyme S subunit
MNKNTISEKSIAGREERGSAGQHQGAAMKKGWQTKTLADLVEVQNGYAFSSKDYSESGHFLMRIGNVQNGYISTADPKFIKLPADGSLQRFVLSEDDILVSLTGNVGRVGVIQESHLPAALNQRVARISIRKDSPATRELLLLFLCSDWFREELIGAGHGAAQQNVSTKDLVEIEIPIPPLAEQHRIVGLLDEAFEGLATAKANAEKNLQNARALFESHLQSVFTQRGPGWVEKPLGEVCVVKDGTHDSPKYVADGIPFVTQKNIREDGLSFEKTKFISQVDHDDFYRRSNAAHGDILISMIGANRGMACIVDDERTFSIKNVGLVKQNPSINQEFLLYFLKSPQAASFVKGASKGGAQEFVGLTELRRFPVPLPSLELQNAFAETFQSLRAETQRLARLYESKLTALAALKKSLLHQAFTGQL